MAHRASTRNDAANDSGHEGEEEGGIRFYEYQAVAAIVLGISLPGLFLQPVVGPHSVALFYLLGVVLSALFVGRGPSLLAALLSALFWDVCFLDPVGRQRVQNPEDTALLGAYLLVALFLGQITTGLRTRGRYKRLQQRHFTALHRLTGKLAEDASLDQVLHNIVQQTEAAFAARIAVLLTDSAGELSYHVHAASTYDITGPEQPVAAWALEHGRPAGLHTGKFPQVDTLFVPLTSNGRALGVMGLNFEEPSSLSREQRRLLEAFSQHIARALGRHFGGAQFENEPDCWLDPDASVKPCPP